MVISSWQRDKPSSGEKNEEEMYHNGASTDGSLLAGEFTRSETQDRGMATIRAKNSHLWLYGEIRASWRGVEIR
jgi:hypothetical protein